MNGLLSPKEAEAFFTNVLGLKLTEELEKALRELVNLELALNSFDRKNNTLKSQKFRVAKFRGRSDRLNLRLQIAEELFNMPFLENDEKINLGTGGSAPVNPSKGRKCCLVIGLPASGKSGYCRELAQQENAYIVDNDFAKRKFPEFKDVFGATLVHEEADHVTLNAKYSLFNKCTNEGYNIIVPKIGANYEKFAELCEAIKYLDYEITLILIQLDRRQATINAF